MISKCYDTAAEATKVELDKPENKKDPYYEQAEFSYFLVKYRSGYPEYKEKIQKLIADTQDQELKSQLQIVYDNEVVQ